ncbi:conserved exported protein of unknown function [Methylacidimicrobium sp. AP8]|uniref:hypothetical protein n=1 Tax=Methylacidimicrobium sp. AP8 TaxID=2730359 RepID=UPI0018C19623|nr:hypothetical protein [Methylacidimicrobium sp. AP8]CAB4243561.1 conserved exported protein of unknown function [Methylacidimicrobium sp. AP8]
MRPLRFSILASVLLAWTGNALVAREIPDLLGGTKPSAKPEPKEKGESALPAEETTRKDAPAARPETPPVERAPQRCVPGVMRRSLALPSKEGCWVARWIHPDGEESGPIPLWIDRQGNGHFLLEATMVLGEDLPFMASAPRVSACQVLSLFQEPGGGFRPIASDVWIELPAPGGATERRPTGKGGWRGVGPLVAPRNVFSPFLSALREADDPAIRSLAAFRWPDVVLLHLPGKPPVAEEGETQAPPPEGD